MPAKASGHIPARAVLLICCAVACFATLDTGVKHLTQRYPIPFLVWARYLIWAVAMLVSIAPTMRLGLVRSRHLKLQIARGALLLCSSICFVTALKSLPLAEATALNFLAPVLVVILSVLILGERLTRLRMALIGAGFVGMLLIVRPGTQVFQGAALLALATAGLYATFQIMTRKLAAEDSRVTAFYPAMVGTLLMTLALPWFDFPARMAWLDAAILIGVGLLGTFGHFLFIRAFQYAPASAVTPFTYLQLVWATLAGWAVFGNFPDPLALAGMAVITASGLLVALRERALAQAVVKEPLTVD
jgi:drug/metabolite transporter (DMT)-like permease